MVFFLTIMITPMYISALTFHPEILPYELLLNLQESRSKVPFPPLIEVLFIELIVEVLREAGSRMPAKVGQTIGIVGGIVIGTAAVQAGLLSNILIVLVATSALLSFLPPIFLMSNASRFVRYIFILSAGLFGLFGQMLAFAWLIHHLLSLKSLGTHYMTPGIPRNPTDLLDNVIRFPINYLTKKIRHFKGSEKKRQRRNEVKDLSAANVKMLNRYHVIFFGPEHYGRDRHTIIATKIKCYGLYRVVYARIIRYYRYLNSLADDLALL
ncbi:spore germination protein [Lysinibacillus sp. MHQ-1]|nr:spore germination protein [Lysinibacillus sp. MHQ-1]